uniref:Vasoactive intestinal peptide receptor 2 n=1 Tax=Canis lupus familiaris TaxID=9615 RepID=A0A8P0SWX0_CANLF
MVEFLVPSIFLNLDQVNSVHPECRFHLEIQEEETKCAELLKTQTGEYKACTGVWDNITCWRPADVGETVTVPCPKVFSNFYSKPGNISKNCTRDGWSEMFPDFIDACGYHDAEDESKITFYILVKAIYTLGYSASLVSLTTGSVILCVFRGASLQKAYVLGLSSNGVERHYKVLKTPKAGVRRRGFLYPSHGGIWTVTSLRGPHSVAVRMFHGMSHALWILPVFLLI